LHFAVSRGDKNIVEILIEKGADINAKRNDNNTALHFAARRGSRDIVEFLLEKGADLSFKDNLGYTPLGWARKQGYNRVIALLLEHGAKESLHDAVIAGDIEAVKRFLSEGCDISSGDSEGLNPLHLAAMHDHSEIIELLIAKGADIEAKDGNGLTPLQLIAAQGTAVHTDVIQHLLDKGAKVNAKDDESGFTALHHAARFGNKNAAELLIASGADINAKDKQGHTPLHIAVNHGYKVADLLISKGADGGIRTVSGQTLLQLAQKRKEIESTIPDIIFDGNPDSFLGSNIACGDLDGDGHDDILMGAVDDNESRGRVYLFYGGADLDTTADLILEGQNKGDWFGDGIVCGDIDNDGYDDIIIGASGYNEKQGRAYLYWGNDRNSMDADPDKIFVGEKRKGSRFGVNAPVIYDIDNDGYDDIILGSGYNQDDYLGRAYLYYGSTKDLMDTSVDLIFTAEDPRDQYAFGFQIACGNLDNDGYGDIVIGSQSFPLSRPQVRAHLYYGDSRPNMDAKADVVFEVKSEGSYRNGRDIVSVDQNADGFDDIIIGASGYNSEQGRTFLFHGNSKRNLDTDPDLILDGEVKGCSFGRNTLFGDVDGDNVNDIIIGAFDYRQRIGRVYVYWGSELTGPDPKPGRIFTGENPKDWFGRGLACGDVNNDGFDDLVIGAPFYKAGARQGRVYLYYGRPLGK
jgi:ankyrin repeat protein